LKFCELSFCSWWPAVTNDPTPTEKQYTVTCACETRTAGFAFLTLSKSIDHWMGTPPYYGTWYEGTGKPPDMVRMGEVTVMKLASHEIPVHTTGQKN